jgi:hypothetical protein
MGHLARCARVLAMAHSRAMSETAEYSAENEAYEAPRLDEVGSLRDLTRGNSDGEALDAAFPVNTPKRNLTFS